MKRGLQGLQRVGLGDGSDSVRCALTGCRRLLVAERLDGGFGEANGLESGGAILFCERNKGRGCGIAGRLVRDKETGNVELAIRRCDGSLEGGGCCDSRGVGGNSGHFVYLHDRWVR